jgi:hypothetical protein
MLATKAPRHEAITVVLSKHPCLAGPIDFKAESCLFVPSGLRGKYQFFEL